MPITPRRNEILVCHGASGRTRMSHRSNAASSAQPAPISSITRKFPLPRVSAGAVTPSALDVQVAVHPVLHVRADGAEVVVRPCLLERDAHRRLPSGLH